MSALLYCLQEIRNQIPHEVLSYAMLVDEVPETHSLTSLDDKILTKVVKRRVLRDANIVGGMELLVPLTNTPPLYWEDYYTVYRIDKTLTHNREIVSALGLSATPMNVGFGSSYGNGAGMGLPLPNNYGAGNFNPINAVAQRIGDSAAIAGIIHNAHLELVGPNTVLVNQHYRILSNMGMRVIVENESNLNNIQPRSWKNLSLLCVLAVKAYIYNKLIVHINNGVLAGGQELGMFKSIVESYDSAEEDYATYLAEIWTKVAFMNDTGRYNRMIGSMIQPDL